MLPICGLIAYVELQSQGQKDYNDALPFQQQLFLEQQTSLTPSASGTEVVCLIASHRTVDCEEIQLRETECQHKACKRAHEQ